MFQTRLEKSEEHSRQGCIALIVASTGASICRNSNIISLPSTIPKKPAVLLLQVTENTLVRSLRYSNILYVQK